MQHYLSMYQENPALIACCIDTSHDTRVNIEKIYGTAVLFSFNFEIYLNWNIFELINAITREGMSKLFFNNKWNEDITSCPFDTNWKTTLSLFWEVKLSLFQAIPLKMTFSRFDVIERRTYKWTEKTLYVLPVW